MREITMSADQIRNAAKSTFAEAQMASYMASVAGDWTLAQFQEKTGLPRSACRDAAYRWGVVFPDYNPFAKPKRLEWRKADKGWTLLDGEAEIGDCLRAADGKYCARLFSRTEVESWNARRAMSQLSRLIDEMSPDLPGFNGLPVKAFETNKGGLVGGVLFPDEEGQRGVNRCRDALAFRATVKEARAA